MSGTIIPLFSKRSFTFSDLAANKNQLLIIVKALDVSQYTSGTIEVRVHSNSCQSGTHIYVRAYTTTPSSEDPASLFVTLPLANVGSVDINTQSAPILVVDALDANFGGMLLISVEGYQDTALVKTVSAELSAQITLKS